MPTVSPLPAAIPAASPDLAQDKLSVLRAAVPEAFNLDGSLNPNKLKEALGEACEVEKERFGLNWPGKQEAFRLAGKPTTATLRPQVGESVDFDTTQNAIIEGDNLEVLKVLQRSYHGKIKMIYIDPPYNTGSDFVYPDDYAEPLASYKQMTNQVDEDGRWKVSNGETSGRKHSNWLNLMGPRLMLARNLLRDDGVIFVSIDDNEVAHLRLLMDEVFGGENFVANICWKKRSSPDARTVIGAVHDWVFCYTKNSEILRQSLGKMPLSQERVDSYVNPDDDPRGPWASVDMTGMTARAPKGQFYNLTLPSGRVIGPPEGRSWGLAETTFYEFRKDNRIWFGKSGDNVPRIKKFLAEADGQVVPTFWDMSDVGSNDEAKKEVNEMLEISDVFDTPKPIRLIQRMLQIATSSDSLILDFFAGSGTTAHAVMAQNALDGGNRKFILVQLPEPTPSDSPARKAGFPTIAHITRERVRRAGAKLRTAALQSGPGAASLQTGVRSSSSSLFADGKPSDAALKSGTPGAGVNTSVPGDFGFRAFTLDTSNFAAWNPTTSAPADLLDRLKQHADSTVPGRSEQDLLCEILIKAGFAPTVAVEKFTVNKQACFGVAERQWVLCLEAQVSLETLEAIAALTPAPSRVVCLDGALLDDATKANAAAFYRQKGIELRVV